MDIHSKTSSPPSCRSCFAPLVHTLVHTVDRNPYKQGKFLPGTHIPIHRPEKIRETRPDYLFILPWNFKEEIMEQNAYIREWSGRFVVPIPTVEVYP